MQTTSGTRSLSILIPAARTGAGEDPQAVWGDVRVALASIAAYAPDVDVVLAWNGLEEPRDLPPNPHVRLVRQVPGIRTASAAWNFAAAQTDAEDLLILGDDCVLTPDTLPHLLEDRLRIEREIPDVRLGFVGARSNYVKGPQNIRCTNAGQMVGIRFDSEDDIIETAVVVPIAALIRHDVLDSIGGFPNTNWFGDDLACWDLRRSGHRHFVSRAYVHHVGQRATGEGKSDRMLFEEGIAWLSAHRPDFLEAHDLL